MTGPFVFMMTGQGGYVWAAFGLSFVLMAAEAFRLRQRWHQALQGSEGCS